MFSGRGIDKRAVYITGGAKDAAHLDDRKDTDATIPVAIIVDAKLGRHPRGFDRVHNQIRYFFKERIDHGSWNTRRVLLEDAREL